jgi:hypothetical protein
MVSCPAAVALSTSRCLVGTDKRPLTSKLSDDAPWNTAINPLKKQTAVENL